MAENSTISNLTYAGNTSGNIPASASDRVPIDRGNDTLYTTIGDIANLSCSTITANTPTTLSAGVVSSNGTRLSTSTTLNLVGVTASGTVSAANVSGNHSGNGANLTGVYRSIAVGTVTTGSPGTEAAVTNVGNSTHAVLDFTIPRGDVGDAGSNGSDGAPGSNGSDGVSITGASISGDDLILTLSSGGPINAGNVRGPQGTAGSNGSDGTNGTNGNDGAPGPNEVTASTSTSYTGVLYGTGSIVSADSLVTVSGSGNLTCLRANITTLATVANLTVTGNTTLAGASSSGNLTLQALTLQSTAGDPSILTSTPNLIIRSTNGSGTTVIQNAIYMSGASPYNGIRFTDDGARLSWWSNTEGVQRLAAGVVGNNTTWDHYNGHNLSTGNVSISNATIQTLADLRVSNVVPGNYVFELTLFGNHSVPSEGVVINLGAASNATVSTFAASARSESAGAAANISAPGLAFASNLTTTPGAACTTITLRGTMVVTSTGNVTPQVGIASYSAGTLTLFHRLFEMRRM